VSGQQPSLKLLPSVRGQENSPVTDDADCLLLQLFEDGPAIGLSVAIDAK
jgi:hypothetical protein